MLVKFAIDPQSLIGDADTILTPLEDLIDQWEFFGILVNFDDVDDALAAARIDQNIRIAWGDVLTANEPSKAYPSERYRTGHPDDSLGVGLWDVLSKQPDAQSIARELAARRGGNDLELAVIEETVAYFMGVHHQNASLNLIDACGGVEPIGLSRAHRAAKFQDAKRLSLKVISKDGEDAEHDRLWANRFQRLAAYSSKIVIVDQWALSDGNIDGFVKMLRYIDKAVANNCPTLTLYSKPESNRDGIDFNKEIPKLREILDGAVTKLRIRVRLLDPYEDFHDRYIRFDHNVFTTSRGLPDAFKDGNSVKEESIDCTLKDDPQSLIDLGKEERRLDKIRRDSKVKWTAEDTLIAIN